LPLISKASPSLTNNVAFLPTVMVPN